MVAWNLSVALTGNGDGLVRVLGLSRREARGLSRELAAVRRELDRISAGDRSLRSLTTGLRTTTSPLRTLRTGAAGAGRDLRRLGSDANRAASAQRSSARASQAAANDLRAMSRQIRTAAGDLAALARAARTADGRLANIGRGGTRSLRETESAARRVRAELSGLTGLLAGGGLVLGLHDMIEQGNEFQRGMATFGAVTGASASQMQRASATAKALGADMELPTATAAGAAEAMVELAKAGFRTDQAISATRASLQLSAAANVDAADSAKYLGDMMDQFALGADQAGRAADILAATANSASGDIIDIYYSMKYAGPVAHGLGVSMEEAAAAVGMLGKAGILGQTAGTTLRGIFTNLAKPTAQMTEGLREMGIEAWDTQGRFKGLRYVIEKLSSAQHEMSQQDFTAAAAKAFGKPALSGAIALAHQGVASYDALNLAVKQNGAAAAIAAAKNQGLAGAMTLLKKQTRQTGLEIYSALAPGLEWLTRGLTSGMAAATPYITSAINYTHDLATLLGPDLAKQARNGLGGLADQARSLLKPLKALGETALADGLHLLISAGQALMTVLTNLADGLTPIGEALATLGSQTDGAANALDVIVLVLDAAAAAVEALSTVLVPIGHLVGGLVSAFGALPGPVQTALFGLLLYRRVGPVMSGLATTVRGRVTGAFASLNAQMAVQRSLAAASGQSLTRYGAAMAVLQTRVPLIGAMSSSFRTAAAAGTGFTGTLNGITRAAGTGLRGAMTGLMGVMGGPWGVALAGITVGLGLLASQQQKAAQAAAEHQQRIADLTRALRDSGGVVDANVRAAAAQTLLDYKLRDSKTKLVDVMEQSGVSMRTLTDAYLGQGTSLGALEKKYRDLAEANKEWVDYAGGKASKLEYTDTGERYKKAADALKSMRGEMEQGVKDAKRLAEAQNPSGKALSAYDKLKLAVGGLADRTADADQRTRALKEALDLLSGGSVSVQAAQARLNEAILNANDAVDDQIKKSGDYGKSLLGLNGTLNTASRNGQQLFNSLNGISDAAASSAIAAFDFAQKQGKDLPQSLQTARTEMTKARTAALDLLEQYGITGDKAKQVADAMGLIPGQVSILLQTQGVDQALAELLAVQAEFARFPDRRTVKVEALGEEAQKELKKLGYAIELIPGTREYKITAPTLGARKELDELIAKMAATPSHKNVKVDAATRAAIADLEEVQKRIRSTKGRTITMRAPTTEARRQLELLGFRIKNTKGKKVTITAPTGTPRTNVDALSRSIESLRDKSVTITTHRVEVFEVRRTASSAADAIRRQARNLTKADGGVVDYYAKGGIQRGGVRRFAGGAENHIAQIAPAGSWRVWGEPETQGEGYVPFARAKRPRSRAITEEIVRRLGGDPTGIQWNANGSVTDWRYDPQSGSLYSPSDAGQAGNKTRKVRVRVKGKWQTKEVEYFDISAVEKKLKSAAKATRAWNRDLEKVAERAGGDVAEALASMGQDGMKIAHKMATGSTKYIQNMSKALRDLQTTAKATLTDYTRQLTKANQVDAAFSKNLATLAAQGYGDLARQLAAQNDEAAQQLAAVAVKDKKKASTANTAAKTANSALPSDQVEELVQIISAITSSKVGIHKVAETTGLTEDDIIDVASKAKGQIKTSLGTRATQFLADLDKATKGLAYADGGIREGIYATRGGLLRFAEPSTHGEAYIPLALGKRHRATAVLDDVAGRFGYTLTGAQDAQAGRTRVIIIRQPASLIGSMPVTVSSPAGAASPEQFGAEVMRRLRNAQRGGRV
ncbi:phage tail tape measure protein [Streptomyces javensis]|uniref:Phage tail tape measure protein n=1 Tax=Streptomyces javensis TaxID=114698 RepID=A0ABS0RHL0_9ACTN|nr:phage tail tape measure protein [Streptomyces javensis]MBI0316843.1 phage tail tape measure protein [Streptomyces javensis]